ncbi:hypothetical protein SPRG_17804 [Saprolegnia parasitica CBS 223.65]|uniref:Uncharacterized protein n=1 Tax=Saprolegnia parasitica (strain CBS 223.65) TaxID=695850 RepID=A0A067BF33_SAPPC|nr:hypothetical protein SPRG_17804 [Saprolegnia parasitica CBS 223.65]KDO16693.1 hypothetical protein SPRG_17804 [Saprolegnia parasitica CBS 223.65]|eukprot:XP_012212599.1 hypothetical protein SPRG_17804 [Saprolegnia parasitica CBS 223.65]
MVLSLPPLLHHAAEDWTPLLAAIASLSVAMSNIFLSRLHTVHAQARDEKTGASSRVRHLGPADAPAYSLVANSLPTLAVHDFSQAVPLLQYWVLDIPVLATPALGSAQCSS